LKYYTNSISKARVFGNSGNYGRQGVLWIPDQVRNENIDATPAHPTLHSPLWLRSATSQPNTGLERLPSRRLVSRNKFKIMALNLFPRQKFHNLVDHIGGALADISYMNTADDKSCCE